MLLGHQRTQRITGSVFRIFFHPDSQIDDEFLNRPIMAPTRILVYTCGGPERGFRRSFADGLNQSLVPSVTPAT